MITETQIEKFIFKEMGLVSSVTISSHILPILCDIQDVMLNDRVPNKFIECIINNNWDRAICIADSTNREILTGIPPSQQRGMIWEKIPILEDNIFSLMINKVRKTKEYRNIVISNLLEDEE